MRDISVEDLLLNLLTECVRCREWFLENIALVSDSEAGTLTDEQVESALLILSRAHVGH
jgi:hypothetical protein